MRMVMKGVKRWEELQAHEKFISGKTQLEILTFNSTWEENFWVIEGDCVMFTHMCSSKNYF